jgi:hypothetical protein
VREIARLPAATLEACSPISSLSQPICCMLHVPHDCLYAHVFSSFDIVSLPPSENYLTSKVSLVAIVIYSRQEIPARKKAHTA